MASPSIHERAVIEVWGACIKVALQDALGTETTHAEEARLWLDRAGFSHLLTHPGASWLSADARKKRKGASHHVEA